MSSQLEISFFNTIDLAGKELSEAENQACKQDDRVLQILKSGDKMTPFEVSEAYNSKYSEAPVTSIRRSMTVLTDRGLLIMCDEMKVERFGKPNHYWKVK